MKSINPYSSQTLQSFEETENILEKIKSSEEAFVQFKQKTIEEKKKLLLATADVLEQNREDYATIITLEMGKLKQESLAEIDKCAWVCRYYAEEAPKALWQQSIESDAKESYVSYEPLGTLLTVMPWNYPFWQFFRCAAPALMLGNTLLLKHASNVPQCALAIEEVFQKAGYEKGVMQTLLISSSKVGQVIENPIIKAVTLTGSEKAGSMVAKTAGEHIKKTVLELGGSDPFIVLEDADINKAVEHGVQSRFMNCGQSCIAAKRFILHKSIYEEFLAKFIEKVDALKMGDPMSESTTLGPMARADLAEELETQVQKSVDAGAKLLRGGKRVKEEGAFFEPTILIDIPEGSLAYKEELFGPVASVYKVDNVEEALVLANDTKFGLGASLWTSDKEKAKVIARKIESGGVFVNGLVKSDPRLPFGGIKTSGYGRELSLIGLHEFANVKTVWLG